MTAHRDPNILLGITLVLCIVALTAAILAPQYIGEHSILEAVGFTEVMVLALWSYPTRIFPILIAVFLWAGTAIPLNDMWTSRRWFVLAGAALGGVVIYIRDRRQQFGGLHLLAFFCVVAALVSGIVSPFPRVATLKALSLFLLFIYTATGARLAALGREARFFASLLLGCEILTYATAFLYFVLRQQTFGNPNSLGAIFGVAVLPILLWGVFVSERPSLRRRRGFALMLGLLLLLSSYSRAGITAFAASGVLLCVCLRRYRFVITGGAAALLAAVLISTFSPVQPGRHEAGLKQFLYKGGDPDDLLASRRSIWDATALSIRRNPWFGTGFGTVATSFDSPTKLEGFTSTAGTTREHGNSYLALAEWVGLLGIVPFLGLALMTARNAGRVLVWVRRTGDPFSPGVPLAVVAVAGLVHAGFEDWLFAVGYYLCVFYWSGAFIMADVLPQTASVLAPANVALQFPSHAGHLGIAASDR